MGQRAAGTVAPTTPPFRHLRDVQSHPKKSGQCTESPRDAGEDEKKPGRTVNDTNTATSAPHRSHAVAGWSQAAGTPHDPLPACNATGSA